MPAQHPLLEFSEAGVTKLGVAAMPAGIQRQVFWQTAGPGCSYPLW